MDQPSVTADTEPVVERPLDLDRLHVPVIWVFPLGEGVLYIGAAFLTVGIFGARWPPSAKPWVAAALWLPLVAGLRLSLDGMPLWYWTVCALRFWLGPKELAPGHGPDKEVRFHP